MIDDDRFDGAWDVIEDIGSGNAFASFHQTEPSVDSSPLWLSDVEIRDAAVVVPQSNEWETQSSNIVFEEPIVTNGGTRILSDHPLTESRDLNDEAESELIDDKMIGVSDEPWFNPIAERQEEVLEIQVENENELPDETIKFIEQKSASPVVEHVDTSRFKVKVQDEFEFELEEQVEEELDVDIEVEVESPSIHATEASLGASQLLPSDLLGNSNSLLRSRKKSSPIATLFSIFGGGLAAIPISILLMWYVLGKDPLEAGPLVAKLVPWIVPDRFRGGASPIDRLQDLPPMLSRVDSNDPRMLPPIGGTPVIEHSDDLELSTSATIPFKLDETSSSASTSEVSLSSPLTSETTDEARTVATLPIDPIAQSLAELENAVEVFDPDAPEAGAILFRSLESFGELLAAMPDTSPEYAEWRSKATKVCQTIVPNTSILIRLQAYASDHSKLTPSDLDDAPEETVSADFVLIDSTEASDDHDIWRIEKRFQPTLASLPVVVPRSLELAGKPTNQFLIVGVLEEQPDSKERVFRVLFAAKRK